MPLQEVVEQIQTIPLERNDLRTSGAVLTTLKKRHWVSTNSELVIRRMTFGVNRRSEQIAIATPRALDFFRSAPLHDVFRIAKDKFGLAQCSNEDVFDLRLQLQQEEGESLLVATELVFLKSRPCLFNLKTVRDGSGICLTEFGEMQLDPDDLLAFRFL